MTKEQIYKAKWYQENKERLKEKGFTEEQKKRKATYKAQWHQENKERLNKRQLERRRTEPVFRLNHLMSSGILKSLGRDKNGNKWTEIIGYNGKDLLEHFGVSAIPKDYHIDHIIPKSLYYFTGYDDLEFQKCWSIRNLRLIPAGENLSKGDKLDMDLILENDILDLLPTTIRLDES